MERINDFISYIKPIEEPISANVFFINTSKNTYIYDVGASEESFNKIEEIKNDKIIILSHFHQDHSMNINRITYKQLYIGDKAIKYFPNGIIVNENKLLLDEPKLELIPIISSHCKGSIMMNINNTYLLTGDSLYCTYVKGKQVYNTQLLNDTIKTIENIDTKYIVLSHDDKMIYTKEEVLNDLKEKYNKREKNCPYIYL